MIFRDTLHEKIIEAISSLTGNMGVPDFSVEVPEITERGDYATNVALMLAKSLGRSPVEIAKELAEKLQDERWKVSVAPPGFLNFVFTDKILVSALQEIS